MMDGKRILVAYATNAGSTEEVAQFIADEFTSCGAEAEAHSVHNINDITAYGVVIVGAPILYGRWPAAARNFVGQHEQMLRQKPVAFFTTCMRLGYVAEDDLPDVPVFVDPVFGGPRPMSELTAIQRGHALKSYVIPLLEMGPQITPVSIAIFKGKYDGTILSPLDRFVMWLTTLADGLKQGDYRNWDNIREWVGMVYAQV